MNRGVLRKIQPRKRRRGNDAACRGEARNHLRGDIGPDQTGYQKQHGIHKCLGDAHNRHNFSRQRAKNDCGHKIQN